MILYEHPDGRRAEVGESRQGLLGQGPYFANLFPPGSKFRNKVVYHHTHDEMHGALKLAGYVLVERRGEITDTQRLDYLLTILGHDLVIWREVLDKEIRSEAT